MKQSGNIPSVLGLLCPRLVSNKKVQSLNASLIVVRLLSQEQPWTTKKANCKLYVPWFGTSSPALRDWNAAPKPGQPRPPSPRCGRKLSHLRSHWRHPGLLHRRFPQPRLRPCRRRTPSRPGRCPRRGPLLALPIRSSPRLSRRLIWNRASARTGASRMTWLRSG
jgi:hypothetical protein